MLSLRSQMLYPCCPFHSALRCDSMQDAVTTFYRETDWMFRVIGLIRGSTAMHAGLWGPQAYTHAAALAALNRDLATRAGLRDGLRLLDAGCGAGSCALWLARRYDIHVLGITLAPGQALQATSAAEGDDLATRARFACLDFARTGLPDASFDVIWAVESVCHAPDLAAFLYEARRLLRPGGRLVIADRFRSVRPTDAAGAAELNIWYRGWALPGLATIEQLRSTALAAGFGDLLAEEVTARAWPSLRFLGQFAALSLPAALALRAVGLQSAAQISAIRGCIAQYASLRRGLWGYWLVSASAGG